MMMAAECETWSPAGAEPFFPASAPATIVAKFVEINLEFEKVRESSRYNEV